MLYLERIQWGLHEILANEEKAILLGEDIKDPYGGAFKATRNLSSNFSGRIVQTPISEAGFVGVATGLALQGFKPIVEVMFGDFVTLIVDIVINSASKFTSFAIAKNEQPLSLLIRTPMGGRRGYGPIHSQTLEKIYFGWPHVGVISPNLLVDPAKILISAFYKKSGITLFIENKLDYSHNLIDPAILSSKGFHVTIQGDDFPVTILSNAEGDYPDVVLCCYGGMVRFALDAAYEMLMQDEITCALVIPTAIYPLDVRPISGLMNATNKLLVAEEGYSEPGWGAYLVSELAKLPDQNIKLNQIKIIGPSMEIIPASVELEDRHLPGAEILKNEIRQLLCAK